MKWYVGDGKYNVGFYRGHILRLMRHPNSASEYELKIRLPYKLELMLMGASGSAYDISVQWRRRINLFELKRPHEIMSCSKEVEECMQFVDEVADWLIGKINKLDNDGAVDKEELTRYFSKGE